MKTFVAYTENPISFQVQGTNFLHIPQGAEIVVDPVEEIAYYEGYHFYIDRGEYYVLN